MTNACIIGNGMVGNATAKTFGISKCYDTNLDRSTITLEEAAGCKYVFICLPTPNRADGGYELRHISQVIKDIRDLNPDLNHIFIIRSTVSPGFASFIMGDLGVVVVSNPEFLSEDTWEQDIQNPALVIVGCDIEKYREDVAALYKSRYSRIMPNLTDNTTAEYTKLAMNSLFSTKTIWANEIFNGAQDFGANYEFIKGIVEHHPWGLKNHLTIYYKGKRGVGGHCLPKDLRAMAYYTDSKFFKTLEDLHDSY